MIAIFFAMNSLKMTSGKFLCYNVLSLISSNFDTKPITNQNDIDEVNFELYGRELPCELIEMYARLTLTK